MYNAPICHQVSVEEAMGYNFLPCDRDQLYLLPPALQDWLPEDDLAWFILDAVVQMDLAKIERTYRADGWGQAAYEPAMMVALLLYAYCLGERSSRRIERLCKRDVAFRVITANQGPDHTTIARFRQTHEKALASLFTDVLRLCAEAGLAQRWAWWRWTGPRSRPPLRWPPIGPPRPSRRQ